MEALIYIAIFIIGVRVAFALVGFALIALWLVMQGALGVLRRITKPRPQ